MDERRRSANKGLSERDITGVHSYPWKKLRVRQNLWWRQWFSCTGVRQCSGLSWPAEWFSYSQEMRCCAFSLVPKSHN